MSNQYFVYGKEPMFIDSKLEPMIKELNFKLGWTVIAKTCCGFSDSYYIHDTGGSMSTHVLGTKEGIPVGFVFVDTEVRGGDNDGDTLEKETFVFVATEILQDWRSYPNNNFIKSVNWSKLVRNIIKIYPESDKIIPTFASIELFNESELLTKIKGSDKNIHQAQDEVMMGAEVSYKLMKSFLEPQGNHVDEELKNKIKYAIQEYEWAETFKDKQEKNKQMLLNKNYWVVGKCRHLKMHYIGYNDSYHANSDKPLILKAYEDINEYPESDKIIPTLTSINSLREEWLEPYEVEQCIAPYNINKPTYVEDLQILTYRQNTYGFETQWVIIFDV